MESHATSNSEYPLNVNQQCISQERHTLESPVIIRGLNSTRLPSETEECWQFQISNSADNTELEAASDPKLDYKEILKQEEEKQSIKEDLALYVENLKARKVDGEPIVSFPLNYLAIIEQLFVEHRESYDCLKTWIAPGERKSPLVAQESSHIRILEKVPNTEQDQNILEGFRLISELDEKLKKKELEGYVIEREICPHKFLQKEGRRRRKRAAILEQTMKTERQRLRDIVTLRSALESSKEPFSNCVHSSDAEKTNYATQFLRLKPEEEAYLAKVLSTSDEHLFKNPFDCEVCLEIDSNKEFAHFLSDQLNNTTCSNMSECSTVRLLQDSSPSKKSSLYQSLKPDYLHEMRGNRERTQRIKEIDKQLQTIRTRDFCEVSISAEDIRSLILLTRLEANEQQCQLDHAIE